MKKSLFVLAMVLVSVSVFGVDIPEGTEFVVSQEWYDYFETYQELDIDIDDMNVVYKDGDFTYVNFDEAAIEVERIEGNTIYEWSPNGNTPAFRITEIDGHIHIVHAFDENDDSMEAAFGKTASENLGAFLISTEPVELID